MRKFSSLLLFLVVACTPVKKAQNTFTQGDYAGTIASCKKILAADSTNAEAYYLLAQSYSQLHHVDSAVAAFDMASYYAPENEKYKEKYYLAVLQRADMFLPDDTQSALAYFDKAIQIDTSQALAVEKKSDLYFDEARYESAQSLYRHALALGGDSLRIQNRLVKIDSIQTIAQQYVQDGLTAMEQKKFNAAKKMFEKALDEKPDYKEAHYQLHIATGLRFYQKGSVNALWDALDSFGRASFIFPERGEPHYYTGLAYTKKDKEEYVNAIEALEQAIAVEPDGEWADEAQREVDRIRERKKKMDAFFGR